MRRMLSGPKDLATTMQTSSSRSSRVGSWPARSQNLVRCPDMVIRGWLGALSPLRGGFVLPGSLCTEVVFRNAGLSKWLCPGDAARRDPKLEAEVCWRCCALHFLTLWMRASMACIAFRNLNFTFRHSSIIFQFRSDDIVISQGHLRGLLTRPQPEAHWRPSSPR